MAAAGEDAPRTEDAKLLHNKGPTPPAGRTRARARRMGAPPPLAVDERCAERCAALAESVARCEREERDPGLCKAPFSKWRTYCVTNSACNPSGRQVDPMRMERKCEALAKRLSFFEAP